MNPAFQGKIGTLYLVGTPIGNLEDISYRAVRLLSEVDSLFCEDTRRTSILLRHYNITRKKAPESFHDHSSRAILEKIKARLKEGHDVAYATDGGMPVVSDPGFVLVRAALQVNAEVKVIPGPSAAVSLFAASGLPSPKYLFHGFFPRTRGEVERTIETIKTHPIVHLFYEAPGRIQASLEVLARNVPEAQVALGRELTKMHEEILRGSATEVHERLEVYEKVKGECVIAVLQEAPRLNKKSLVSTPQETDSQEAQNQPLELTPEQQAEVTTLIKSGVSSKDAAKLLSKRFNLPRRVIYEFIIRHLT